MIGLSNTRYKSERFLNGDRIFVSLSTRTSTKKKMVSPRRTESAPGDRDPWKYFDISRLFPGQTFRRNSSDRFHGSVTRSLSFQVSTSRTTCCWLLLVCLIVLLGTLDNAEGNHLPTFQWYESFAYFPLLT